MFVRVCSALCSPAHCVVLVVPHHNVRVTTLCHALHYLYGLELLWASVDEVPNENSTPRQVLPHTVSFRVTEATEKLFEFSGVAVDVTDDV